MVNFDLKLLKMYSETFVLKLFFFMYCRMKFCLHRSVKPVTNQGLRGPVLLCLFEEVQHQEIFEASSMSTIKISALHLGIVNVSPGGG